MSTKIITVAATPPGESSGSDYNKGAPLNATEFDQNLVNLRAAVDRRALAATPTFTGIVTLSDTTESSSTSTGCLVLAGGLGLAKKLTGVNAAFSGAFATGTLTASSVKTDGVISGATYPYNTTVGSGSDASLTILTAGSTAGQVSQIYFGGGGSAAPVIAFLTSSAERLRITSGGDVLIPSIWANAGGTTAVMVASDGRLYKLTSSERYKKDIEDIDPAMVDAVMAVRAVWHKLKDPQGQEFADPSFYGFIAEEMAEVEPRLVSWTPQYKEIEETVIDKVENEDGTVTETPRIVTKTVVDESLPLIPDGVDYQRITAIHHNKIQRLTVIIEQLEMRLAALEQK